MQDSYELIEKYLNGELTDVELTTFENTLQTDIALRRLVKLYETGSNALARQATNETQKATLQTTLEQLGEQYFTEQPASLFVRTRRMWQPAQTGFSTTNQPLSIPTRRIWQLAIAASILLLAVVGLKWYTYQYYTTEVLVAQNYHPIPAPATLSGNDQNLLQPGYQAYRQKLYRSPAHLHRPPCRQSTIC